MLGLLAISLWAYVGSISSFKQQHQPGSYSYKVSAHILDPTYAHTTRVYERLLPTFLEPGLRSLKIVLETHTMLVQMLESARCILPPKCVSRSVSEHDSVEYIMFNVMSVHSSLQFACTITCKHSIVLVSEWIVLRHSCTSLRLISTVCAGLLGALRKYGDAILIKLPWRNFPGTKQKFRQRERQKKLEAFHKELKQNFLLTSKLLGGLVPLLLPSSVIESLESTVSQDPH